MSSYYVNKDGNKGLQSVTMTTYSQIRCVRFSGEMYRYSPESTKLSQKIRINEQIVKKMVTLVEGK